MAQRRRIRLRPLTGDERTALERVARAGSERAERVARAKALLAVADGAPFTAAARRPASRAGDAVAHLVERFNQEGTAALDRRHGGGPPVRYGSAERERILHEFRRPPERTEDQTATWSLATLRRALRRAPDGLPTVSTATILHTSWEDRVRLAAEPHLVQHGDRPAQAAARRGGRRGRPGRRPQKE